MLSLIVCHIPEFFETFIPVNLWMAVYEFSNHGEKMFQIGRMIISLPLLIPVHTKQLESLSSSFSFTYLFQYLTETRSWRATGCSWKIVSRVIAVCRCLPTMCNRTARTFHTHNGSSHLSPAHVLTPAVRCRYDLGCLCDGEFPGGQLGIVWFLPFFFLSWNSFKRT